MTSREKILSRIKVNQPQADEIFLVDIVPLTISDRLAKFKEVLISIGGAAIEIENETEIVDHLPSILPRKQNKNIVGLNSETKDSPHAFEDTDIAIVRGEFAVAENGSVWVTDAAMIDRALPFICSHLVLIIFKSSIVSTMHDAYEKIGSSVYELGTFIAGPSKTADIEQSLVLGAHGAKTMTCFIIK
jgi:L-lactate dehydrogenase complex protein LldG